ncbi:MAG: META domain-containing protein [Acidimicrobiia bacterium]
MRFPSWTTIRSPWSSTVGGTAACNTYFGGYTISGAEITFSGLGQTMMACSPDEVMESETKYLQALLWLTASPRLATR